jgi:hypothetical protein
LKRSVGRRRQRRLKSELSHSWISTVIDRDIWTPRESGNRMSLRRLRARGCSQGRWVLDRRPAVQTHCVREAKRLVVRWRSKIQNPGTWTCNAFSWSGVAVYYVTLKGGDRERPTTRNMAGLWRTPYARDRAMLGRVDEFDQAKAGGEADD